MILIKNDAVAFKLAAGFLLHWSHFRRRLAAVASCFVVTNLIDYVVPSPSSPSLPSSHRWVYLTVEEAKLAAWHSRGQTAVWIYA